MMVFKIDEYLAFLQKGLFSDVFNRLFSLHIKI